MAWPRTSCRACPGSTAVRFHGEYPFARIAFGDAKLPLEVELEAFNPMAPLDAELSGLPVAIFTWKLHNPGPTPVDATLAFSMANLTGYDGVTTIDRNSSTRMLGRCLNSWTQEDGLAGIAMTTQKFAPDHANLARWRWRRPGPT